MLLHAPSRTRRHMLTPMPELLEQAADEIMCEKPDWRDDGCDHMLDMGVVIAQRGTVEPLDTVREGRYLVGSHLVNIAAFTCPCSEFDCQGTCRHIIAVLGYDRARQLIAEFEREYGVWDANQVGRSKSEGGDQ